MKLKRCLPSLAIRKMKIKMTMKYQHITNAEKTDKPSIGEDVQQQGSLYIVRGNVKWYNHFGKHWAVCFKHTLMI